MSKRKPLEWAACSVFLVENSEVWKEMEQHLFTFENLFLLPGIRIELYRQITLNAKYKLYWQFQIIWYRMRCHTEISEGGTNKMTQFGNWNWKKLLILFGQCEGVWEMVEACDEYQQAISGKAEWNILTISNICTASSRVGTTIKAPTWCFFIFCKEFQIQEPRKQVFPDPVKASTTTSFFARNNGRCLNWSHLWKS